MYYSEVILVGRLNIEEGFKVLPLSYGPGSPSSHQGEGEGGGVDREAGVGIQLSLLPLGPLSSFSLPVLILGYLRRPLPRST